MWIHFITITYKEKKIIKMSSDVVAIELDQMFMIKLVAECFDLRGCDKQKSLEVLRQLMRRHALVYNDTFFNIINVLCPLTYKGSVSFLFNNKLKRCIDAVDVKQLIDLFTSICNNQANPEIYDNNYLNAEDLTIVERIFESDIDTIKNIIGTPSVIKIKTRFFPFDGREILASTVNNTEYVEVVDIDKYTRKYPMPNKIRLNILNELKEFTLKDIFKFDHDNKNLKMNLSELYLEMKFLRNYYSV